MMAEHDGLTLIMITPRWAALILLGQLILGLVLGVLLAKPTPAASPALRGGTNEGDANEQ